VGTLIDESSPLGNVQASVEDDGGVVYFYLYFHKLPEDNPRRVRACWVRNRGPAPRDFDPAAMQRGEPPLLPARYCRDPASISPLEPARLRIVWLEEGDAAALLEDDEILAIIPGWSGDQCAGYARDCSEVNTLCWPLLAENVLRQRVADSAAYWHAWNEAEPWVDYSDAAMAALEQALGPHSRYFAIDNDEWPPKALVAFEQAEQTTVVTMGLGLLPQPGVPEDAAARIELGLVFRGSDAAQLRSGGSQISGMSGMPWQQFTWFGENHTISCGSLPWCVGGAPAEAVLVSSSLPNVPQLTLPKFRDQRVQVLWLHPISAAEQSLAMEQGTEALLKRLKAARVTGVAASRPTVVD
jgi:hypothetical protein